MLEYEWRLNNKSIRNTKILKQKNENNNNNFFYKYYFALNDSFYKGFGTRKNSRNKN